MASDPNALLRRAEAAFAGGALAEARSLVEAVLRQVPGHAQLLQFLAVIARRQGDAAAAHRAAAAASAAAPDDPRIAETLGHALSGLGRHGEALAAYDRAIALGSAGSRLHRASTLEDLGRRDEARSAYAALPGIEPLLARAGLELADGAPDAAVPLLDRVLAQSPGDPRATHARVKAALERGEPDARARLDRARAALPGHRGLLLEALEAHADAATAEAVEAVLRAEPGWAEGRRALARFRRERQGRGDWLALHEEAIAHAPRDAAAWEALIALHADVEDFAGAAAAALRAAAATGARDFRATAFGFHVGAGAMEEAARLLADPAVAARVPPLVHAKYLLRARDPAAADALLARARADDLEAWAVRGVAWQALGDRRWEWLHGRPGLVAPLDLGLSDADRAAAVALLRRLHEQAALRVGQSVRGGTQTSGNLFVRLEPELARVREAIFAAAECYRAGLPPADPAHPLLRYRDRPWRMSASWSVRLAAGGFHVSHIHPKGVVSSASYWVLPPPDPGDARAGWLELGRPPAYLGLDLPPIATIEPVPGRLVLFPSTLHHGTRPFAGGERITAAFDLAPR